MVRYFLLIAVLVASLALNVATIAVSAVATVVSTVFEAVTGSVSVAGALQRDLVVERKRASGLATEVTDIKARNLRSQAEVNDLKQQVAIGKRRAATLNDDLVKAKTVSIRGRRIPMAEAVGETAERIAQRTAAGASKNIAATFGESVPFYGIAVVVAATAWEMKDACATMNDLHDLDVAFNPEKASAPDVTEVCGLKVPTKEELWQMVKHSPGKAVEIAKGVLPDLPDFEVPELPDFEVPEINWTFWD